MENQLKILSKTFEDKKSYFDNIDFDRATAQDESIWNQIFGFIK